MATSHRSSVHNSPTSDTSLGEPGQTHPQLYPQQYSVTALYNYLADPDDPFEISFNKGDILDVVDQQGKWWIVITQEGSVGFAPSNYLRNGHHKFSITAMKDYTANGDDKNEVSFTKGEVLDILDQQGQWWQVKKTDGSVGYAPSSHLVADPHSDKRKSFSKEINGILSAFLWCQTKRADDSSGLGVPDGLAEQALIYRYQARARSSYTANPSDPNEISFRKNELLDIAHKRGRWWVARKAVDGAVGVVPSTYLEIISEYEQTPMYHTDFHGDADISEHTDEYEDSEYW
ncbi:hypothetical protein C8R45DRAFT_967522 [Mycena sanguinolenta]|nr:hypothetical protein C8R45DRAFT_967522 [Mycena sanguinolenta]